MGEPELKQYLGDDGERIVLSTRQHPIVIFGTLMRMLVGVAAVPLLWWLMGQISVLDSGDAERWGRLVVVGLAILWVLRWSWCLVQWNAERLVVSSHKVLHAQGVLNRDVASTPLVKVDELVVRQSLLGRILDYGRLDVENAAGGQEPLHGLGAIPKPGAVYQLITDSARRERMLEGGARVEIDS